MAEEKTKKLLLTPAEARKILGWSKNTIYEVLATDKTFPAFRINNGVNWYINADKLSDWIDAQTNKR